MIPFDKDRRLDIQGRPLYGRVFFYQKDTEQLDTIYVFDENDNLIQCNNPVYTDLNGFLEYDVILDNRIYSIHQESYKGDYTDPKSDSRQIMWVEDRDYYAGFSVNKGKQDTIIYGYESIAEADPELGSITVVGYHTEYDCDARTYVWDSTSNDSIDYGQVFGSSLQNTGRWILVNSLPYIPSEYYGVYPGHLENMSNLFGASLLYGSDNKMVSPRVIKMKRGDYNIGTSYNTSRTLLLEDKTDFGSTHQITCKDIQFAGAIDGNPIGNFKFNGDEVETHSCIFYDINKLMASGAKTIHIYDKTDSQTTTLTANYTLTGTTFIGHGCLEIPKSKYSLTFDNCHFIGEDIFDLNDAFKMLNMVVSDRPFKQFYTSGIDATTCTLNIENFRDVNNFVQLARSPFNLTDIDLQGRSIEASSQVYWMLVGDGLTYRNGSLGRIDLSDKLNFVNCIIDEVLVESETASFTNCHIGKLLYSTGTTISLVDSVVNELEWDKDISCTINGIDTVFNSDIGNKIVQGKTGDSSNPFLGTLNLVGCDIHGNIVIRGPLSMEKTFVSDSVWTQDYSYGSNYVINSIMKDCTVGGRHILQHYIPYRTGVRSNCVWIGNNFLNTEKNPIYPESWSDPLGEGKFTKDDVTTLYLDPYPEKHTWTYKSNIGPKVIPEYPMGAYVGLFGYSSETYGDYIKITSIPFVAPGHVVKSVTEGEIIDMNEEDLNFTDEQWTLRFHKELYWTDSHTEKHEYYPIIEASQISEFITNKSYPNNFTCKIYKDAAFYENSSEAYFRVKFKADNLTNYGEMEMYGTLDVIPVTSVNYVV